MDSWMLNTVVDMLDKLRNSTCPCGSKTPRFALIRSDKNDVRIYCSEDCLIKDVAPKEITKEDLK